MPACRFQRLSPLAFLAILIVFFSFSPTQASEVIDASVEYKYGEQIEFKASVSPSLNIQTLLISFRTRGEADTVVDFAAFTPQGDFSYIYKIDERPIRAFTMIDYWFTITTEEGEEITSPTFSFKYDDNRFVWQHLVNDPFQVYWFEGDLSFAQSVLDVASEGLKRTQSLLPLQVPDNLTIYVYANANQIPETPGKDWVAGHAYPDLGLMVVSLPDGPERRLEMERQIPHELMHILLYETTGQGYENLPTWLNEGLATMAQLYPTPEYQILLENAIATDGLLPIASLCQNFPLYASSAYLSYAEATYFTRYIYRQYGSTGLSELVAGYANGLDCERGVDVALGISLARLEDQWLKESLGARTEEPLAGDSDHLLPWFFLLFVVLALPLSLAAVGMLAGPRKQVEA
jgi:hypothetical protein